MEIIALLVWVSGISLTVEFSLWVIVGFCGIVDAIGNALGIPIDSKAGLKQLPPDDIDDPSRDLVLSAEDWYKYCAERERKAKLSTEVQKAAPDSPIKAALGITTFLFLLLLIAWALYCT